MGSDQRWHDTARAYPHEVYQDASGRGVVEPYSILLGTPLGQAVGPGTGVTRCGAAGRWLRDMNICASCWIGHLWGLDATDGAGPLPVLSGLGVSATTDTSASLSWTALDGAAFCRVYGGSSQAGSPSSASFSDTGLASGTTYGCTVAAVDDSGAVGASSTSAQATTTGAAHRCYTENNYHQVAAGRAHRSLGQAPQLTFLRPECDVWNVPAAPRSLRDVTRSGIPTLVFLGGFDSRTGADEGTYVARTLSRAEVVTVPYEPHVVFATSKCPQQIAVSFFDAPTASNTAYLKSLKPPRFETGP
ncbi:alpha/beta hydrolase [Streptomyces sp. NPDC056105]|uniref:alpha/beta hydrolase n=1 Tax=Streptomyces sp. NPDC056105 TaxID=3345714 RepID=UPI0035D6803E